MSSQPALAVRGLVAGYAPGLDILRGVSLEVGEREIVTVLGPNGAGKSTLVKAVAGLVQVRAGDVQLLGASVTGMPAHRLVALGLAYVPQRHNVFVRLSVQEHLEIGACSRTDSSAAVADDVARLFDMFPRLRERRRQRAGTLSGGERQMLALARAMMARPRVLMLDEPSAGLAPAMVEAVFTRLREVRELGVSLLVVEQNARAALAVSDRGCVLVHGRNRADGDARTLLANAEVEALFLGAGTS
jgi:ABC-type branched-subunit amino acid transport system ATPase component